MFVTQPRQQCHRLHVPIFSRIISLRRCLMTQPRVGTSPLAWRLPRVVETTLQKPSLVDLQREQLNPFGEDYRIYQQNIDLDAFFGEEPKYEKVSDVCLLNDHFILVKMPPPEPTPPPPKSKIPRCFKCNRGSRVSPVQEEVEDDATSPQKSGCLQPWSSRDQEEIEEFDSSTRLTSGTNPVDQPASVIVEQPHPTLQLEAIQSTAPEGALQVVPISRGPLHWFLWPFRRRETKPPLAAVHKTYFVRWTKPPDTLWPGFGVDRTEERKFKLRRCRSAVF
ncbi:uncharacterized protein [Drosophila bipectinata]|uniref:uncharacterized protein n=1 Tax=Drosophila bipectinata TaxID=42026 RepID=UPI001C8A0F71|nr:uncharacterized protein LOC108131153 [Drosophila bipectinata]XP_043068675.1 uncharacterized protein LOC108131153 [Drosophila bipectinata]